MDASVAPPDPAPVLRAARERMCRVTRLVDVTLRLRSARFRRAVLAGAGQSDAAAPAAVVGYVCAGVPALRLEQGPPSQAAIALAGGYLIAVKLLAGAHALHLAVLPGGDGDGFRFTCLTGRELPDGSAVATFMPVSLGAPLHPERASPTLLAMLVAFVEEALDRPPSPETPGFSAN